MKRPNKPADKPASPKKEAADRPRKTKQKVLAVISLDACDYRRNFGLTQCGCAT